MQASSGREIIAIPMRSAGANGEQVSLGVKSKLSYFLYQLAFSLWLIYAQRMEREDPAIENLPLRERKRHLMRRAILESADRLFGERGYDHVTVAEIADAANVSVKTLFTHFRSKEDLVFQDSAYIDAVVAGMRRRPAGTSPANAIAGVLGEMMGQGDAADGLAKFQQSFGGSEAIQSRILRLWAEYEDALAAELAREAGKDDPTADMRFHAAQLAILLRAGTWKEIADIAARSSGGPAKVVSWFKKTAQAIGQTQHVNAPGAGKKRRG